jgi:hypothetical protein
MYTTKANTSGECLDCGTGPFARNHYFTGKLLVERDFTDEQRYFIDKNRLHNRQLHGCGIVCGLRVTQHEAPECQARYVRVEPGTAIDCCGRTIVVPEAVYVDLTQFEVFRALADDDDDDDDDRPASHRIQICLRYRECPTEEIPVLYDECGCDETQCAPNRILESYEVDLVVNPPEEPRHVHAPRFERRFSVPIDGARMVALDEAGGRLYVYAEGGGATIFRVATADGTIDPVSRGLAAGETALALLLSADGGRLYVVVAPPTAGPALQLRVLDTADLAGAPVRDVELVERARGDIALAHQPDGRLLTLMGEAGKLYRWGSALDDPPAAGDPPLAFEELTFSTKPTRELALSADGRRAYVLDTAAAAPRVRVVGLDGAALTEETPIGGLPSGSAGAALAVVTSSGPDRLALATNAPALHLIDPAAPELLGTAPLSHKPRDLVAAPGGGWVYALVTDTAGATFIQAVNVHRLGQRLDAPAGAAFPIGAPLADRLLLTAEGDRLYVPYPGAADTPPVHGAVALVDVHEDDCAEILWRHLDGCPDCSDGRCECVVLATIVGYRPGFAIRDVTVPPSDPERDLAERIARIDNRAGRPLLPSTQTLLELIECLMERGPGGAGRQGPPGPPGRDGLGIDAVDLRRVPCNQDPTAPRIGPGPGGRTLFLELPDDIQAVTFDRWSCNDSLAQRITGDGRIICNNGVRTLVLRPPRGIEDVRVNATTGGAPAGRIETDPATEACTLILDIPQARTPTALSLPRIVGISWIHDATYVRGQIDFMIRKGLVIAFSEAIQPATLNVRTVEVLYVDDRGPGLTMCFCNLRGTVTPGRIITNLNNNGATPADCGHRITDFRPLSPDERMTNQPATGVLFESAFGSTWPEGIYKVIVKGDFILAHQPDPNAQLPGGGPLHRALDANHLGPGLPRRCPTGDGVEGGTFESWFEIRPDNQGPNVRVVDPNRATVEELRGVRGIGEASAERIVAERERRLFRDPDDFRERVRPDARNWTLMRDFLSFEPGEE